VIDAPGPFMWMFPEVLVLEVGNGCERRFCWLEGMFRGPW
jgi:hypothetical protein